MIQPNGLVRTLATRLSEGLLLLDANMRIQFVNNAATQLLEMECNDLVGADFVRVLAHDHATNVVALLPHGPDNNDHIFELAFPTNGGIRSLIITSYPSFDHDGRRTGHTVVIRDQSDQKHTEELEREIAKLRRMDTLGGLSAGLVHDFNNVLSLIVLHAETIERNMAHTEEAQQAMHGLHKAIDQGSHLTTRLLDYLVGAGAANKPTDASAVTQSLVDALQRTLGSPIDIRYTSVQPSLLADIEASQLEELLVNLAMNARDAMNGSGTLRIDIDEQMFTRDGQSVDFIHIAVSDTGPGMTENESRLATSPFFTTKEHEGATGLGLSSVVTILDEVGGFLTIDSKPGEGTTMNCYMPAAH